MDIQDILKKLFPNPQTTFSGRNGYEVNGLSKGTVPQNCEILATGLADTRLLDRQEHYLVRVGDALVYTRVCAAMEGSGYDEFAVVHGVAVTEADKMQLTQRATDFISSCCIPKK